MFNRCNNILNPIIQIRASSVPNKISALENLMLSGSKEYTIKMKTVPSKTPLIIFKSFTGLSYPLLK